MARSTNMIIPEVTTSEAIRAFMEKVDLFNAASNGSIVLRYDQAYLAAVGGDYREPVVFARPSAVDTHVDEADPTGADSAAALTQAKGASVFQARRAYLSWQRDELMRGKKTGEEYSEAVGRFIADYKIEALRNNLVAGAVAAVDSMDTPTADCHILDVARGAIAGAKVKFTFAYLNTLLGKMGDAREDITTLLMPSAIFTDLIADGITNYKIENVGGMMIVTGVAQAMGRTILVADVPALTAAQTSSYYTEYNVLGLGAGALEATIISEDDVIIDTITTTKVKSWTARQDYDAEFVVQGMKWITVVTDVNPTDAELATAAHWDEFLSDHREMKIVKGVFNAS